MLNKNVKLYVHCMATTVPCVKHSVSLMLTKKTPDTPDLTID